MFIKNHQAYRDYRIIETKEAGVVLRGAEIKSLRAGRANFSNAILHFSEGEVFLVGAHISSYSASREKLDPKRTRKLLLNKREILSWENKMKQGKLTAIPLQWYNKGNLIKLEIGLGKKKKNGGKKSPRLKSREFRS